MTPWLRNNVAIVAISVTIVGSVAAVIWQMGKRDADLTNLTATVQRIEGWAQVVEARQRDEALTAAASRDTLRDEQWELRSSVLVLQSLYQNVRADMDRVLSYLRISDGVDP